MVSPHAAPAAADAAVEFLAELARLASGSPRIVPPPGGTWSALHHLMDAATGRAPAEATTEAWWAEATGAMLARIPDADRLALDWLCAVFHRHDELARLQQSGLPDAYAADAWLQLWAIRRPLPGAARRFYETLHEALDGVARGRPPWHWRSPQSPRSDEQGYAVLLRPLRHVQDGQAELSTRALDLVRLALATPRSAEPDPLWRSVLHVLAPPLLERGDPPRDIRRRILLAYPFLPRDLVRLGTTERAMAGLREAVDGLLADTLRDGAVSDEAKSVLLLFNAYAGLDHFLAAASWLARPESAADPGWALHVLGSLPPPSAADRQRVDELRGLPPSVLVAGGLLNPEWAALLEATMPADELDGVYGLAVWRKRFAGAAPWAVDGEGHLQAEPDLGAVPAERAALAASLAAIGAKRARATLKHRLLTPGARLPIFCLDAVLGANEAEVEARFLKRDKWGVVALGMLPDEGDAADRYVALRRFGEEAERSGPQRRVGEQLAVEIALAHLAATAGYEDAEALAWAIEIRIGADLDPARRWTVGDNELRVGATDDAPILVSRGGKTLKSVPANLRGTPEYAEARDLGEALRSQVARARRHLERAMVRGDVFDRAAYDHLLALPAGRRLLPRLVLRIRMADDTTVDLLDGRTLAGAPVALAGDVRVQVVHPLRLAEAGTLAAWQRRLVETGGTQPLNQLFRGLYGAIAAERDGHVCRRFEGRTVNLAALRRLLRASGWSPPGYHTGFVRRGSSLVVAELLLQDWRMFDHGSGPVTIGEVVFRGRSRDAPVANPDPLRFAEVVREVDLATAAASALPADQTVSPEQIAVRAGLVRALVPAATTDGEIARFPGGAVHLRTGAAYDAAGTPILLPKLAVPAAFPYPEPEPAVAEIVARAFHLATVRA